MKIAFIGQKGIPALSGGVERHVEELATRLAKEGHEVICYCRNYYTPKNLKEYRGVKLIHLPSIRTKHLDAISHTFLATIDLLFREVDIIHYQAIGPSSLLWLAKLLKRKTKVLATFHSDDRNHQKWGWLAKKFLSLAALIALRLPDRAITVSRAQKEKCQKEFGGDPTFIANGVSIPEPIKPKLITKRWGLRGNDYILSVSRLVKHKGIHYLIEAYQDLKTDKKLVIVGDTHFTPEYGSYLKELARDNKKIIFTGEQTGQVLAELFSNAYLFVQPSESEGLSIALLEALSYSLPTLVSDIAENKEAIAEAGFVFRNKSVSDLKRKLKFLLANPEIARDQKIKARNQVMINHDWNKIVRQTVNLYEQLLLPNLIKNFGRMINYSRPKEMNSRN